MSAWLKSGPVRPMFRALAWVLGPLLVAAGVLLVILDLRGVTAHGWPVWSHRLHTALWLGLGNLALGLAAPESRRGRRWGFPTDGHGDHQAGAEGTREKR